MFAAEIELLGHVALARIDIFAIEIAVAFRAVETFADCGAPLIFEVGHFARDARHRVHAPHCTVAPGRVEQSCSEIAGGIVHSAGKQSLGFAVALGGQTLCFGQCGVDSARHFLGHSHPPSHRLGVAERDDAMLIVPFGFIVAFLELEAEILPPFHLADCGKRHPKPLLRRATAELLGEHCIVLCQSGAETPGRLECETAKTQLGRGFLAC